MLVGPPCGELRQIVDDLVRIGVEDVRPILVDQDARLVEMVVGVAADMRPPVDDQHVRVVLAGQPLGDHRAGEAGADDEIVVGLLARPR